MIGGGLSGLMAARRLRLADPQARITVIERSAVLGGLLAGRSHADAGLYFDLGTHIFQETGNADIDTFLQQAIGSDDLILFPPGEGDAAGVVFDGRLQTYSHFPDLRPHADSARLIEAVRRRAASGVAVADIDRAAPLLEVATQRFGPEYVSSVLAPLLSHAYALPAERLAAFAMLLPGLTRVIVDDEAGWQRQAAQDGYRAVAGFPDQAALPAAYRHGRRSFYSRRHGSHALVDGVSAWLRGEGVRLMTDTTITRMDPSASRLTCRTASGAESEVRADRLVFSTGPVAAAGLMGVDIRPFGFEAPMPHWIVNLLLDRPPSTTLCYVYGMDPACDWYRFTNYRGFSGDGADRRITLEVVGERALDPGTAIPRLLDQLRQVRLIEEGAQAGFADMFRLPVGFPLPTTRNMGAMTALAGHLRDRLPAHVLLAGIGSRPGLFFQNEVVLDIYERVGAGK